MTQPTLMAIWAYDQFPYFLCGKVLRITEEGRVQTEEYSTRQFKPLLLLPIDQLEHIKGQMALLAQVENEKLKDLKKQLLDMRKNNLPKAVVEALENEKS